MKIWWIGGAIFLGVITTLSLASGGLVSYGRLNQKVWEKEAAANQYKEQLGATETQLASISATLGALRAEDQLIRNDRLESEIKMIEKEYEQAAKTYEELVDLREIRSKRLN